jgi:hypothetical protein
LQVTCSPAGWRRWKSQVLNFTSGNGGAEVTSNTRAATMASATTKQGVADPLTLNAPGSDFVGMDHDSGLRLVCSRCSSLYFMLYLFYNSKFGAARSRVIFYLFLGWQIGFLFT